jgi:hypothetical protein|tara:strand:+ start:603 stop:749 length:147 start_codon:yes stop_codon:yes gene_type:complete
MAESLRTFSALGTRSEMFWKLVRIKVALRAATITIFPTLAAFSAKSTI